MTQAMQSGYIIRTVGTSCCNPSINKGKMEQILNEMEAQGFIFVDQFIDVSYKCLCMCPDRSSVMIFKK